VVALASILLPIMADTTRLGRQLKSELPRIVGAAAVDVASQGSRSGQAYGQAMVRGVNAATTGGLRGTARATSDILRNGLSQGFNSAGRDAATAGGKAGREYGRKAGEETRREAEGGLRSMAKEASMMVAAEFGTFGIEKAVGFLKESVDLASDLGETSSKLTQLFGEQGSHTIEQWAQTAAGSFGLSRMAAEDAASEFGVFAKSAGLSGQGAVDFSEKLTGLAGDLTSFYNPAGGTAQSIDAIGAALRGESEPIRQFGVLLDDATLRNEALKMGLISTTKQALTPQQRVMAAYQSILKQTAVAQGDYARTSDSFANRQRTLSNEIENTKIEIGQALLPVMTEVLDLFQHVGLPVLSAFAHVLGAIPTPVYGVVAGMIALGAAIAGGKKAFGFFQSTIEDVNRGLVALGIRSGEAAVAQGAEAAASDAQGAAMDRASAAGTRLGTALGKLATAAAGVGLYYGVTQLVGWAGSASVAQVDSDKLADSLQHLGQTGDVAFRQLFNRVGWGDFSIGAQSSKEAMDQLANAMEIAFGQGFLDKTTRMLSFGASASRAKGQIDELDVGLAKLAQTNQGAASQSFAQLAQHLQAAGYSTQEIAAAFPKYTATVQQATGATQGQASAQGQAAAAAQGHGKAAADLAAQIKELTGGEQGQAVTLKDLIAQYPKYKETVMAAVGATEGANAEEMKLTASQIEAAKAAVGHKKALDALTFSLNSSNNAMLQLRGGEDAYWAAVDATTKAIRTNKRTLDVHTEAGRANRGVLDSLASAGLSYLGVIQQNEGVGKRFQTVLRGQWQRLYDAALQFTGSTKKARDYADQIYKVPKGLALKVSQPGMTAAQKALADFKKSVQALSDKTVHVHMQADGTFLQTFRTASGGTRSTRIQREGGPVVGGTPGKDSVPILAMHGEHVWTAREVEAAGGQSAMLRMRQAALSGELSGFAAGGAVTRHERHLQHLRHMRHLQEIRHERHLQHVRHIRHLQHIGELPHIGAAPKPPRRSTVPNPRPRQQPKITKKPAAPVIPPWVDLGGLLYGRTPAAPSTVDMLVVPPWQRMAEGGPVTRNLRLAVESLRERASQARIDAALATVNTYTSKRLSALMKTLDLGGGPAAGFTGAGGGNAGNMRLGQSLAASYGWTGSQWLALRSLWMGESGWNNLARNPSSGAFGIPQALPPGKMGAAAVAGSAYAQIIWGLRYIRDVYRNPLNAWNKWNARHPHWYDAGGWIPPGGFAYNGSSRPERVLDGQASQASQARRGGDVRVVVMLDGSVVEDRVHVIVEDAIDTLGARIDNGIGG
jgi:hypothetical protein